MAIYTIGGTLGPLNSVRTNVAFPGSAFTAAEMTGVWGRRSGSRPSAMPSVCFFGPRGFIGRNLPLFWSIVAIYQLIGWRDEELPEFIFAGSYAGGTWAVYSLFSSNYSGECISIRWSVPLVASGYWVLAHFPKEQQEYWPDLLILSIWGMLLGARIWWQGPWSPHFVFFYYPLKAVALLS
ncbi:MAG TPA: hypothetical protein VGY99_31915 [Candidatus Binataceae bacterium]|nr:hypothetical protein [Candidatus Binataceae bacterium]